MKKRKRKHEYKNERCSSFIASCCMWNCFGINVYMANANGLMKNRMPMPFGYGAAVVLSGSMEPEFSKNDLIVVKESQDYSINDIVVYQDSDSLVVHRIVSMEGDSVVTKGDANNVADDPIHVSNIKGEVIFCIPAVGALISFLKTPVGIILTVALAIALVEIPRRMEMKKDDEERQKLIDEINELKKEIYK